jgi:hypothetical protein
LLASEGEQVQALVLSKGKVRSKADSGHIET